ncbi:uncharacterized [Tachysurus ichikawai]
MGVISGPVALGEGVRGWAGLSQSAIFWAWLKGAGRSSERSIWRSRDHCAPPPPLSPSLLCATLRESQSRPAAYKLQTKACTAPKIVRVRKNKHLYTASDGQMESVGVPAGRSRVCHQLPQTPSLSTLTRIRCKLEGFLIN